MGFDTSELQALERDFEKSGAKVTELAHLVVSKTAHDIEATEKVFAPVDTGFLENSISTDVNGLTAEIGPTASYGDYVDRGTKNEDGSERMAAQPYVDPAVDAHEPSFGTALAKAGEKALL